MTVFNELTMRSGAGDAGRGWNAGSRSRLVLTMSTTALLLVGANLATPLYPALQEALKTRKLTSRNIFLEQFPEDAPAEMLVVVAAPK